MKRLTALLVLGCSAVAAAPLAETLRARIGDFPGTVALYAKNLDSGATIGIHDADKVRTASTIKLPILCAVSDAVARGKARWTELLTVTKAEKVSGAGVIASEISNGVQLPLRDVANLMIVLSDNTATNMVLERFPADTVNAYLDRIGIPNTRALRKILSGKEGMGVSAAGRLAENRRYGLGVSTPRDMVAILERLERGEIVNAEVSREIIELLKRCQDDQGIKRRLSAFPVANKTGALNALRSDVGIVYTKSGRIAMAITVDGIPQVNYGPDNPGVLLIADLAKLIVDGLGSR
jgi:beta-lactamase class A